MTHKPDRAASSRLLDPRAARSDLALRGALLALLERKPLDQITIREIAAEAGIHYATFFRHHATKEALLEHVAADQIRRLVELTLPVADAADGQAGFVVLCAYVNEHRTLWTTLLTGGAADTMRAELLRISREVASTHAPKSGWLPVDLATACSVSLIFETLGWWLTQPHDAYPIATVADFLNRLSWPVHEGVER